ncbi:hypothetical protein KKG65_00260 [Patescibacteria group bacterium]|nr:hypothetical protein [Patescibacteria group bacterium]
MNQVSALQNAIANLEKTSLSTRKKLLKHKAAKKFYTKSTLLAHDLRQKSTQLLAGAGLVGALLATPMGPVVASPPMQVSEQELETNLAKKLSSIVPHQPTKLSPDNAKLIEENIQNTLGIPVKATLNDQSLNHQVGYIGYEQHLKRYPGDTIDQHDDEQIAGIAPGKGAWGYFAPTRQDFTTQDYLREKYYSVAQTLYLQNWNQDFRFLRDWYKYRKILVVNPANGQAVVTVLADAGPANWTGKQFGGSPETMKELDLHQGSRKGLVLFLFVDDPDNLIPLGPITSKI